MTATRKSIFMIAYFDFEGNITPVKFKLLNEEQEKITIKIERIIHKELNKFAGNNMLIYTCEVCTNNTIKLVELRYELDTCRWYLTP